MLTSQYSPHYVLIQATISFTQNTATDPNLISLLQHKSDNITPLVKTFQWLSFYSRVKNQSSYNGLVYPYPIWLSSVSLTTPLTPFPPDHSAPMIYHL